MDLEVGIAGQHPVDDGREARLRAQSFVVAEAPAARLGIRGYQVGAELLHPVAGKLEHGHMLTSGAARTTVDLSSRSIARYPGEEPGELQVGYVMSSSAQEVIFALSNAVRAA